MHSPMKKRGLGLLSLESHSWSLAGIWKPGFQEFYHHSLSDEDGSLCLNSCTQWLRVNACFPSGSPEYTRQRATTRQASIKQTNKQTLGTVLPMSLFQRQHFTLLTIWCYKNRVLHDYTGKKTLRKLVSGLHHIVPLDFHSTSFHVPFPFAELLFYVPSL